MSRAPTVCAAFMVFLLLLMENPTDLCQMVEANALFRSGSQVAASFFAGGAFGAALIRIAHGTRARRTQQGAVYEGRSLPLPLLVNDDPPQQEPLQAVTRLLSGRLQVPDRVGELTSDEDAAMATVNDFVERLAEVPLATWLDVGRSLERQSESGSKRSTAWGILDATIAARGLGMDAWYAREGVETSAFLASRSAPTWTKTNRRLFAAAHSAAEEAALALLAREHLSSEDFYLLYAPFAARIPATSLSRLSVS